MRRSGAISGILMACTSQPAEAPPPPSSATVAVAPPGAIGARAAALQWAGPRGVSGPNAQAPDRHDRDGGSDPAENGDERDGDGGVAL